MRSAGNFNSEWGYLAPAPSFMRTVRVVLVATAIGATAGAAVVLSLIDRPPADHDRTASVAAHAIVTSVQAAPATATPPPSQSTAALATPVSTAAAVPATVLPPVQAQSPAPVAPPPKAIVPPPVAAPQVAMQPPAAATPSAMATPQAMPAVAPKPAVQTQASTTPLQAPAAVTPSAPEGSAVSDASAAPPSKPAAGFASLSDGRSTTGTTVETTDQSLVPPQTVPPAKKPKPHATYASNGKYQPTPGLGTVLRRLFNSHSGTSYYPNR